jgi:photosystem II stability/assembly factor-like uncharacterized protein
VGVSQKVVNANVFIATTGNGLARASRSPDNGWSIEFLITELYVRCLASDPLNSQMVYAGTQGGGVLRSDDRGRTWRPAGLDGHTVKSLAVSRSEPGAVYAGTKPALVFVSRDGGTHWTELDAFRRIRSRRLWFSPAEKPYTAYVQAIALSPTDPNIINVGIEFGATVRSIDGGTSWTGHLKGALRDCHTLISHHSSGDWVYEAGGTGAGTAVSQDAGKTWTQQKSGLDRHYGWACAADPAQPNIWYVSVSPGAMKAHSENNAQAAIFRSMAEGWQRLAGGLPQQLDHMPYALLTDPEAPGEVYAGLSNGEVWHSADYGESWRRLPFNLRAINRDLIAL